MTGVKAGIENDLFRSYWDDGLLDILTGLGLLVTGLGWESEIGALAAIQAPLWIVLWGPLRRKIVEPRAGFVRFSLARRNRTARKLTQSLTAGIGALVLTVLLVFLALDRDTGPTFRRLIPGLPAVIVAFGACLAAGLTGARRFYVYALTLLVCAGITVLFAWGPAMPLTAAGLVGILCGWILLARFVRASREYMEQP